MRTDPMRPPGSPRDEVPPPPRRLPVFDDEFRDGIDERRWIPAYLSHWTTARRAAARTLSVADGLELRIESDQPDWRAEDAPLRVSNLQTGAFSGPVGSPRGTHRHRGDGLLVRTHTPTRLLFAPSRGRIEITLSASTDPGCMTAAWLVGTEHRAPTEAGEICIFEIDAAAVGMPTTVRTGVKSHHDPRLVTEMREIEVPVDAAAAHTWTVIWDGRETLIGCEGRLVGRWAQSPSYPVFLMLDLFELGGSGGAYPKRATLHRVRGWDVPYG